MHSIFSLAVCALQLLLHRATSIEVRLSPGPNYGRVEVQDSSGTWGTICNTYFNDNSANVVCKALGYNKGISNQGYYGNMPIIYEWIDCTGEETQLSECSPVDSKGTNCGDASVYCFNSQGPQYRLVPGPNYGRVEVGFDDVWGTMCWSYTHWQDARVLCRELGYTDGMFSNRIEAYGPGTGDIMIYRPHCNGDESRFQDCRMEKGFGAKPSACTHQHDWSVFCTVETTSTIILHSFYGRVEFWVDGTYNYRRPVCDYDWDDTDATVLCKEHGFDGGKAVMHGTFNPWSYNGVKSSFQCTGNEAKLTDCPHTNGVNCPSDHNANVICYYNDWSATPTVSLSHGASYGRVRIMYYKVNGLLCDSDFTTEDATVVCKMKNYDSAIGYRNGGFGIEGGHVPFWMQNLACTGSESTILPGGGCSSNHYGGFYPTCRYNYGGVGVVCYNSGASYSYSVRLANGKSNYGRLQVSQYNVWGSVADVLRTSGNVAVVACKELGFDDGMPFYGNPLGKPTSAIFFYNIQCNGDEASLADCTYDSFDNANTWTHNYDLVVQCFDAN